MSGKRLFDWIFATTGAILLSPVFAIAAICVKFDSAGPVIFKQTRVGRFGRPFTLLKFRTMIASPEGRGPKITTSSDTRVTRVGGILRKTKLDELPQLLNVIKGDMSLVGPRPEVPEYVAVYGEKSREIILSIRPGITDNASILFRNESQLLSTASDPNEYYIREILPKKVALYEDYAKSHSILGDICIILRSFKAILLD